jgi:hypothetical protein
VTDEQPPRFGADPILVADRLGLLSVVLIGAFIAAVLAAVLPLQLFNPAWQYGFSGALIDNAPVALLGFALLHLAVYLDPDNPTLQRRRRNLGRLAVAAVLLFLLLIPMQGLLLWRGIGGLNQIKLQQQQIVSKDLQQLRDSINSASNSEQLLNSLPEAVRSSLGADSRQLPFAQLKRRLLADVAVASKQLNQRVDQPSNAELLSLWKRSLRVIVTSLFYTLAFAAFAVRGNNEFTLLQEWQMGWRPWHWDGIDP